MIRRHPWRSLALAAIAAAAAVAGAPFLRADRFHSRIRQELENALHRKVEMGEVRLHLLTGPAFSVSNVRIYDAPEFGIEPLAFVTTLYAKPNLLSLWSRKLEFHSVRLEEPSVNLVRSGAGRWNFEPLLTRGSFSTLPGIQVRNGRINFKFGDTKSLFYLTNVDLNLDPPGAPGAEGRVRFSGEPTRADRLARGMGSLVARGRWRPSPGAQTTTDIDLQLEKTPLGEIIALVRGRDIGLHGLLGGRLRLSGPLNEIELSGRLEIQDLRRWDLTVPRGEAWPVAFRGRLDLPGQRLDLESQSLPVALRFRASEFLTRPRWGVSLTAEKFPAEPLLEVARRLGASLPGGLKLGGTVDGAVGYSGEGALQGRLDVHGAVMTLPDSPPLRFEEASATFAGARVSVSAGSDAKLGAEYDWSTQSLNVTLTTAGMDVTALRVRAAVPLLEQLSGGTWRGRLRYDQGWSGRVQLKDAELQPPGAAQPLKISSANLLIDGGRVVMEKLRASMGAVHLEGDYRYEPKLARPHRFKLALGAVKAAEIEALALPALRRGGILARTLSFGRASVPDWLAARHMDGVVAMDSLDLAGVSFQDLRFRMLWDGTRVELAALQASLEEGTLTGRASVDLAGNEPAYELGLRLKGMQWMGGVDADALVKTRGTGAALLAALRAEGSFRAGGLGLDGCYLVEWPRIRFPELRAAVDGEEYAGSGAAQDDGRLAITLAGGDRKLRITGTLAEPKLEK